ncbi:hypothetical protein M3P05_16520 [Sansalvadorimonas sp. 2012CJ34-2]|uniref:Uncharacterized protein n=1 Tax=Parendozoicomonas callyspongiae TaxID=2942213 RepID=A0ABT0PJR9_9GAMM|nr:hypothetical protein [Sansalvadorimonas sp. 2012CJ34-2]MCL6271521.1 hypothetical protein [Sansalvadorimonas sp. 2012CJ34-2]
MKYCRCLPFFILLISLVLSQTSRANSPVEKIREYINATYGDALIISNKQVEQLTWVLDNPVTTPEMAVIYQNGRIHLEVPRALARLYSLQLLRSGSRDDYQIFISPQIREYSADEILPWEDFQSLSEVFKALSPAEYETLQTGALISSVALSPKARKQAAPFLKTMPEDSNQFLAVTAPYAAQIYPLASHLASEHPESSRLLTVLFMPDSHLRHMMYCEGSMAMYSHLTKASQEKTISARELNLWHLHWLINIAGFRGHLEPVGSLYLSRYTLASAQLAKQAINLAIQVPDANPLRFYLQERSRWLELPSLTSDQDELVALGRLAAQLRIYTPKQGQELFDSFRSLDEEDQARWIAYSLKQLDFQETPAPTYAPALLCNCARKQGLQKAIQSVAPIMLDAFARAELMRTDGTLALRTPLSFRELAQACSVTEILESKGNQPIQIDGTTGLVTFDPVSSQSVLIQKTPLKDKRLRCPCRD